MPSERTTTHYYPAAEIDAMRAFYGGKKCIISEDITSVQWSHMLDAALVSSNLRLDWMLDRNLRQERIPEHAAELRENLVPLAASWHLRIDSRPSRSTLFLHEDLLARTLAFELELQQWRLAELRVGRGDPGRPRYEDVFTALAPTTHRWHSMEPTFLSQTWKAFKPIDCPGVYPNSPNPFPVINTLLSIPFSVLHNFPRLVSMLPHSKYQRDLIKMSEDVIYLWSWDPSPEELAQFPTTDANFARTPKPLPIQDPSREGATYASLRPPSPPVGTNASLPSSSMSGSSVARDRGTFQLPSGQILFGVAPRISWDYENGLQLTAGAEEQLKTCCVELDDLSLKGSTRVDSELGHWSSDVQDSEIKPCEPVLSSADILDWLNCVDDGVTPQYLPPSPASFEKGVMSSMSVNDILMVQGLIDPGVYVQYLDLSSFSCL